MSLKILILNYEYPPLGGGAGVITQKQAELLSKNNQVTVFTSSMNEISEENIINENLKINRLKVKRKEKFKSSFTEKIDWIIQTICFFKKQKELDFDICLAHFSIPGGVVAYYLKRKFGLKYTIVSHGHDIPWFCKNQMFWLHLIFYPFIYWLTIHAEKLFVLSEEMKLNALKFLKKYPTKVVKIPNGSDASEFFAKNKERENICLNIVFAGRLTQQKQPLLIPEIAKNLKVRGLNFKVNVLGDGDLRRVLQNKIDELELNEEIEILGWLDKKEVLKQFQNSDVLIAPTQEEGMSIAILEALFCGLFVVTNPVSGNPDMIDHKKNGYLTNSNNVDEFVKGINCYHENKEKINQQIINDLPAFTSKYDWKNIIEQYEKVLKDVVR